MLDKQVIHEIIARVAKNHTAKAFDGYAPEDIEQEAWVIALKNIENFDFKKSKVSDEAKGLEHFLNIVVSSRLKNLYRDEHTVPSRGNSNNFCTPLGIDDLPLDSMLTECFDNFNNEIAQLILSKLDKVDLIILESVLSGERVPSYYKSKLKKSVSKLLEEYDVSK